MSLFIYCPDEEIRARMRDHYDNRRATDSGIDILSPATLLDFSISNLGVKFGLNIYCAALDADGLPVPYLLLARSSTSLTPLRMSNQIGLADAGYRGELIARVDCLDSTKYYSISAGTRLFQLVQHTWLPWERVYVVDTIDDLPPAPDNRGSGGFGSTGK